MDGIVIREYDPGWVVNFEALRARIASDLEGIALQIEHVGSTAVPGLAAKPIIDMDVVVSGAGQAQAAIRALKRLGYEHRGDLGIPGREAFAAPKGTVPHHLYVCIEGTLALRNHVAIRDSLRGDPGAARKYGDLKKRLAAQHAHDISAYIEGKSAFLLSILRNLGFSRKELGEVERVSEHTEDGAS